MKQAFPYLLSCVFVALLLFSCRDAENIQLPSKKTAGIYLEISSGIYSKKELVKITVVEDSVVYEGYCGIEMHGNSTQFATKKSYEFELRDSLGKEVTHALLGFAPEEDFILLSNYFDKSFTRNALAFFLWERLGHYTPGYRFVELYLNGNYEGLYMLVEKIKVDKNRLSLRVADYKDSCAIYNPWLMKLDWGKGNIFSAEETVGSGHLSYYLIYPKSSKICWEQYDFIKQELNVMHDAFKNILVKNPEKETIESVIDLTSFVDFFIVNELSKNPDAYKTSTYLYRDAGDSSKIHVGPVWDYDLAFGNVKAKHADRIEGWTFTENHFRSGISRMPIWWHALSCNDRFKTLCLQRLEFLLEMFSEQDFNRFMDDFSGDFEKYINRDEERWSIRDTLDVLQLRNTRITGKEDRARVAEFYMARLRWMKDHIMDLECHNPIDEILDGVKDTVVHANAQTKSFEVNLLPDTNLFDCYEYWLINEMGVRVDSGNTEIPKIRLHYKDWPPGNYYLEVSATEYWGADFPAVSYGPEMYYRVFKLVVAGND